MYIKRHTRCVGEDQQCYICILPLGGMERYDDVKTGGRLSRHPGMENSILHSTWIQQEV